jgi:caffeoyl-CoA O-methyltransferase
MFSEIPEVIQRRMEELEAMDAADRRDGTARLQRLRQVPRETGQFLALMAASAPEGEWVEVGTSAAYSSLWIALAARERGVILHTHELLPEKIALAEETIAQAEMTDCIQLHPGDALEALPLYKDVAFCFLDCEKELYLDSWRILRERLVPGGILIADNAINHFESLQPMIEEALGDEGFDSLVLPIGKGELYCRKKNTPLGVK